MRKFILTLLVIVAPIAGNKISAQQITYDGKSYFIDGVNIPWNVYSSDFGYNYLHGSLYDSTWFETAFTQFEAYGINCARVWLFNDGSMNPQWGAKDSAIGLTTTFYANLDDMFKRALKHHLMIIPSIWSFNMMDNDSALGKYAGMHEGLLQDTIKARAFINNVLIPMVKHYENQCNLFAWELMNEPEWAMNIAFAGNTTQVVSASTMQCFIGMMAEAIHLNSSKMVTVGSATLRYNSDEFSVASPCVGNYWKNSAIQGAYNKPMAYLDFYEIHYYDWMNSTISFDPYKSGCQESFWELDKPTLIGESQGNSSKHNPTDMLYNAFTGNYAGVMFWSYNAGADSMGQFKNFDTASRNFRNAASTIIDFDTTGCTSPTGVYSVLGNQGDIKVFPNPASDRIKITGIEGGCEIAVYDVYGRQLVGEKVKEDIQLNTSLLPNGIYTLAINGTRLVKKFAVIH